MSNFSTLFGSSAGAPVGTIASGYISSPDWLPLNDAIYLKADYPDLDTSKMLTFDGQSFTTGPTFAAAQYRVINCGGNTWYAYQVGGTNCRRSTDNGATWTSGTLPSTFTPGSNGSLSYAGGMFFMAPSSNSVFNSGPYYTSTDGLTWTPRTGISTTTNYGSFAFISGRYVAIPTTNVASSNAYAKYSTDGITWVSSSDVMLVQNETSSNWSIGQAVIDVSPKIGLVVMTSNGYSFSTQNGINWLVRSLFVDYGVATAAVLACPYGLDPFGNFVDQSYVLGSASKFGARESSRSLAGIPLAASNIHIGRSVPSMLSENHGNTVHMANAPCGDVLGAAFNGSRLMVCSAAGVISWIDVSPTKFRCARPPTESSDLQFQTKYIKAR